MALRRRSTAKRPELRRAKSLGGWGGRLALVATAAWLGGCASFFRDFPGAPKPQPSSGARSSSVATQAREETWLIVPGKQVGPITRETTAVDLEKLYGKARVRSERPVGGEAGSIRSIVSGPADLVVFWGLLDLAEPYFVIARGKPWHTHRIRIGTTLADLVKLNGGHFEITGLERPDYGGIVSSWKDGKLAGEHPEPAEGKIYVKLSAARAKKSASDYRALAEIFTFRSDDARARKLDLRVSEFRVGLE